MVDHERILGVILAGGASQRFGSDKARALVAGLALVEHVARRAGPQVDALALSLGPSGMPVLDLPVIADREPGQGPLSGILSALAWAQAAGYDRIATFPCDGPIFPPDLVERLSAALGDADCAMAASAADRHYTYGLWRTACLPRIGTAFDGQLRSLRGAAGVIALVFVEFAPAAFFNINRPEDIALAEEILAREAR